MCVPLFFIGVFGSVSLVGVYGVLLSAHYGARSFYVGDLYGLGLAIFFVGMNVLVINDFGRKMLEAVRMLRRRFDDRVPR
ncbi:MAG: hypothetical protein NUV56_00230 [Candidatus Uhrbacteria bacterium]|nr:hypothetical protein [Candidatus Uhrbacteria bacterium]